MDSFYWDSHFETGIEDVDEQHHRLVDIINHFSSLLAENEVVFKDIETVLSDLGSYSEYHFADEEQLMKNADIDLRHLNRHSKR